MIRQAVDALWAHLVDVFTLQFISPFWWYLLDGIILAIVVTLIGWYFEKLRPLAGIITLGIALWLYGYRKGETDVEKRLQEAQERERARQQSRNDPRQWKWPWEQ